MKRTLMLAGFGALMAAGALAAPPAHADYNPGCQTVLWGFLGSQRRTICDGPIQPDGHWERARAVWTPAHQVPATTTCSGYSYVSCSTYGGYWVDKTVNDVAQYPVTDATVLPDEPGHLAPGVLL